MHVCTCSQRLRLAHRENIKPSMTRRFSRQVQFAELWRQQYILRLKQDVGLPGIKSAVTTIVIAYALRFEISHIMVFESLCQAPQQVALARGREAGVQRGVLLDG